VESFLIPESLLEPGIYRLLEVDNRAVFPAGRVTILGLVTRADVIHSWSLPALGVKIDGVPGRLNGIYLQFKDPGVYFGICSEICGAGHSKIPIVVEAVPLDIFLIWLSNIDMVRTYFYSQSVLSRFMEIMGN